MSMEPKLSPRKPRWKESGPHRWHPLMPRVERKIDIDQDTGCWKWNGHIRKDGYACIGYQGLNWLIHRAVYTELVGPIPEGMEIDHLCRVKSCCNPEHLEPVTSKVNMLRAKNTVAARNAAKTHCPKGHEYTDENTLMLPDSRYPHRAGRLCATCYPGRRGFLKTLPEYLEEKHAV